MQKVTRQKAQKLLASGSKIVVCASNINPNSDLVCSYEGCETEFNKTFITHFKYYNCSKETGTGVSFYLAN